MGVTIKICGITRVEDARLAVEAGADALGFVFCPGSPRAVSLDTLAEITASLPPHISRVGVFVNPEPDLVVAASRRGGLSILQFHGDEEPAFCLQFGLMSMKAFRMRDSQSLAQLPRYPTDAWLLDSYVAGQAGGTGEKFNWDLAVQAVALGKPVFLAGGLTAENVSDAITRVRPFGVDVSSGVEASPGKKDPAKMAAFVAAARRAA